jgi:Domain of unknown function (DUF4386)
MMNSLNKTARLTGLFWLLGAVATGFSLGYVRPRVLVSGDAAATVHNVMAFESLFRAGIASSILSQVFFLFLALAAFKLFRDINKTLAAVCLTSLLVGVGVGAVNSLNNLGALTLVTNPDYVRAFQPQQLNAIAMTFLRMNNYGIGLLEIFTAIFLFSFGLLIIRSRYLPWILGVLLMIGACAFPINTFTKILNPQFYPALMTQITMALNALGPLGTLLWLLVMGVRQTPKTSEV